MQGVHDLVSTRLLSTRGGTILVGGLAALLAGAVLLVYLNRYRSSVNSAAQPVAVLVADRLIERGTSGEALGKAKLFQVREVPRDQLQEGAVTDPATLRGRVALHDVLPGQQLTTADFTATASDALGTRLIATQRAVAVPVDRAHGMIGHIHPGDRVDVYVGFNVVPFGGTEGGARPVMKLLLQNVAVLETPDEEKTRGSARTHNIVLRVPSKDAVRLAFSVDNGKVWLSLRPRTGARRTRPSLTTVESVLFGVKPVYVKPSG